MSANDAEPHAFAPATITGDFTESTIPQPPSAPVVFPQLLPGNVSIGRTNCIW